MSASALTIAGSDPSGGAGLEMDLKVFRSFGLSGLSVATIYTEQDSREVFDVSFRSPTSVQKELRGTFLTHPLRVVKCGALGARSVAEMTAKVLSQKNCDLILDPVLKSSSGARLFEWPEGRDEMLRLVSMASLVTPNIPEAELMTGMEIKNLLDMRRAISEFCSMGAQAVLLKGGHLTGPPIDVFFCDGEEVVFTGERLVTERVHGTGCALSSAIASQLALGASLLEAVRVARDFLIDRISSSRVVCSGVRVMEFDILEESELRREKPSLFPQR